MKRILTAAACLGISLLLAASAAAASSYPSPTNIRITVRPEVNNEEQVFICPTDSNIIICNWRHCPSSGRQMGIARSTDGGQTWEDSLVSFDMEYYTRTEMCQSDPAMTVDRFGNYYICAMDWEWNEGWVFAFYRSTDKGLSWTGPVPHLTEPDYKDYQEDKEFITCDRTGGPYDGNVYCSWSRFPQPNRIAFVRSIDGCQSFEDTVIVGPSQTSTGCGSYVYDAGQFSIPIVTSNGNVHVFWMGYALDSGLECTATDVIKHSVSTDGGQTFSFEDILVTASGWTTAAGYIDTYSNPVGDADITGGPFDGNLYIAFTNFGEEDVSRSDVDFVRSTDNGLTWSERYQINDAVDADLMDAFHPWLVCNQEGILVVVFYDQRNDPPAYYLFDLNAAYSFDGGETFTANHRITDVSSNPDYLQLPLLTADQQLMGTRRNPKTSLLTSASAMAGRIAEYIGCTAHHDKINAVWTDSRDGISEVYTANWYLPLLQPRLAYPEDSAELDQEPTLRWSTAWKNYEDRYRVEISPNSDFSDSVVTALIDTNFYTADPPTEFGSCYWRVKAFNISTSDSSEYSPTWYYSMSTLVCGDLDGDGDVDPMDASFFVNWMWRGGPPPVSLAVADVDGSGEVNPLDAAYFVAWMWRGGPDLQCW